MQRIKCLYSEVQSNLCVRNIQRIDTFLEEVHVLDGGTFVVLCGALISNVVAVVHANIKPIIIQPQIIKDVTAFPSPLEAASLAGPPPTAPPPCWSKGGRCWLGAEVDSSHHGSIYRRPDAMPVPADQTRASVVTADCMRRNEKFWGRYRKLNKTWQEKHLNKTTAGSYWSCQRALWRDSPMCDRKTGPCTEWTVQMGRTCSFGRTPHGMAGAWTHIYNTYPLKKKTDIFILSLEQLQFVKKTKWEKKIKRSIICLQIHSYIRWYSL